MVTKTRTNMNELHTRTHTRVVSKNIKNRKGKIYAPENTNI